MCIELKTMVYRRMAMVETNDDRNGIVVHRSISQRSGANQDPRSDRAVDASYFGGLWCGSSLATGESMISQMEDSSCIMEAALAGVQYWIQPES